MQILSRKFHIIILFIYENIRIWTNSLNEQTYNLLYNIKLNRLLYLLIDYLVYTMILFFVFFFFNFDLCYEYLVLWYVFFCWSFNGKFPYVLLCNNLFFSLISTLMLMFRITAIQKNWNIQQRYLYLLLFPKKWSEILLLILENLLQFI